MTTFQCSMCLKTYPFKEWMKLKSVYLVPKHKEFGKTNICTCGAIFHKDQWVIQSKRDLYIISTLHLEIGAGSNTNLLDYSENYFYETMIFKKDQMDKSNALGDPLDFQIRYKTREEAIKGHKDTLDKLEMIILNPQKYPMGIIPRVANFMNMMDEIKDKLTLEELEKAK